VRKSSCGLAGERSLANATGEALREFAGAEHATIYFEKALHPRNHALGVELGDLSDHGPIVRLCTGIAARGNAVGNGYESHMRDRRTGFTERRFATGIIIFRSELSILPEGDEPRDKARA
jgi:hypothetical protein